jgi:hypothetical protein
MDAPSPKDLLASRDCATPVRARAAAVTGSTSVIWPTHAGGLPVTALSGASNFAIAPSGLVGGIAPPPPVALSSMEVPNVA